MQGNPRCKDQVAKLIKDARESDLSHLLHEDRATRMQLLCLKHDEVWNTIATLSCINIMWIKCWSVFYLRVIPLGQWWRSEQPVPTSEHCRCACYMLSWRVSQKWGYSWRNHFIWWNSWVSIPRIIMVVYRTIHTCFDGHTPHTQDNFSSTYTTGEQEAIHSTFKLGFSGHWKKVTTIPEAIDAECVSYSCVRCVYSACNNKPISMLVTPINGRFGQTIYCMLAVLLLQHKNN